MKKIISEFWAVFKNRRQQGLKVRLISGSLIVLTLNFLSAPFGYFSKILLSRTLSIYDFGLFYSLVGIFGLLGTYTNLGFSYSVSYLVPKYHKKHNYLSCANLFLYNLIIQLSITFIVSLIIWLLGNKLSLILFKSSGATNLLFIFSFFLITHGLITSLQSFFMGLQQEEFYSLMEPVRLLITFLLALLAWFFFKANLAIFCLAYVLANLLTAVVFALCLIIKNKTYLKTYSFDLQLLKEMTKYAFPTVIANTSFTLVMQLDIIFLTLFRNVAEVGVYNIILPLVTISSILLSPLNNFLFPLFSHLIEDSEKQVIRLANFCLKLNLILGIYFNLFIILFPSGSIAVLFSSKWINLAQKPLLLLALGYTIYPLFLFMNTLVIGLGFVKQRLKLAVKISFLGIISNALFIYYWGLTGAIINNILMIILLTITFQKVIKTRIKLNFPYWFYLKTVGVALLFFSLVKMWHYQPLSLIEFLLTGIIYTVLFVLLNLAVSYQELTSEVTS